MKKRIPVTLPQKVLDDLDASLDAYMEDWKADLKNHIMEFEKEQHEDGKPKVPTKESP